MNYEKVKSRKLGAIKIVLYVIISGKNKNGNLVRRNFKYIQYIPFLGTVHVSKNKNQKQKIKSLFQLKIIYY